MPEDEGLIAGTAPSDHLEVVYPVKLYETLFVHGYEMRVTHRDEMPVTHVNEMRVTHGYEALVAHLTEMPVDPMGRPPVGVLEMPALLWLPAVQNGSVEILHEVATADCFQGKAVCEKDREQEQELLEDIHSATSEDLPLNKL